DLTNVVPTEYRADAVVTLTVGDRPVLGVVVEVQLGKDEDKQWAWPAYVVNLYARLRCPVLLLVVCRDPVVAAWSGLPIVVAGLRAKSFVLVGGGVLGLGEAEDGQEEVWVVADVSDGGGDLGVAGLPDEADDEVTECGHDAGSGAGL